MKRVSSISLSIALALTLTLPAAADVGDVAGHTY